MVNLGQVAIDRISGFTGVVTARTEFLYSSIRVRLDSQNLTKDGELSKAEWFDEEQLDEEVDAKGVRFHPAGGFIQTGGPGLP